VHKDEPAELTPKKYERFLCETPLIPEPGSHVGAGPGWPGFGSFHQRYRLRSSGKLIAVGVVDILPSCLSSVYFFYDPELSRQSLGVVSALYEIRWVQQVVLQHNPEAALHNYYMGTLGEISLATEPNRSDLIPPTRLLRPHLPKDALQGAIRAVRPAVSRYIPVGAVCRVCADAQPHKIRAPGATRTAEAHRHGGTHTSAKEGAHRISDLDSAGPEAHDPGTISSSSSSSSTKVGELLTAQPHTHAATSARSQRRAEVHRGLRDARRPPDRQAPAVPVLRPRH